MPTSLVRFFVALAALAFLQASPLATAQAQFEIDPPASPPVSPREPGMPLQPMPLPPLPAPRQFPFDQPQRNAAPNVVPNARATPSANATFDPAIVRLMRFGEYQVTIIGARSGIEMPDPLPTPEGLVVELSYKSPGVAVVNGQRVDTVTFHYSTTAARPGTYVMPSFTATVGGVAVTVPAAQVQIREPGTMDLPYQSVTAVIDLPEGEYYVGQALPAKLIVFDTPDENVQAIANVAKQTGDVLFQSQPGSRREQVEWRGKKANAMVTPLRLTPIKPGQTEIVVQTVVFVSKMNATGRPTGNTAQAMLETPPIRVRVRALPEKGRKPGFTGGVGKFELGRPTLSATDVVVGDPVTLTIPISGEGNLEAIAPPAIEGGDAWQSFSPTSDVVRDPMTGRGTKTMTYTLVPRSAEARAIPSVPFSVFDPERGEYVDLTIPPIAINVRPSTASPSVASGEEAKPPTSEQAAAPKHPEPILTGLAEKSGGSWSSAAPVAWSGAFWAAQILPAGALLGLWVWRRRLDYLTAHPEVVRRRAARVATRRYLRVARSAAQQRNTEEFVRASIDAIRAAAAPLDTTQAESMVLTEVLASLPNDAHSENADRTVRRLFEHAHTERFSGHAAGVNGVFDLLPDIESTVSTIERHQP